ncbi:MBL fold metallo-hydrolase [Serratia sp. M24T3]|uniref:MBL fold metallo-hydrolase n=1 Tax=Serratia sp. M24T3 TaxID=932213 RepID=UPI00025BB690|nr:MBL fold metallo-hydrolase [Serratia sp. M24T3]EIC83109.1 beta-lactamase domain-containing protein [Serratia sp. M24T3]
MSRLHSWHVAGARVTKIPEQESDGVSARALFPDWDVSAASAEVAHVKAGLVNTTEETIALSTHSWLVETDDRVIIIDTASGNDKVRPGNPKFNLMRSGWLDALEEAGIQPEDVDSVVLTHLHVDHVGWNTVLTSKGWVPTFPRAKYYFSARELEFYSDPANVRRPSLGAMEDSVIPVVDAGQATLLHAEASEVFPGLQIHRSPGHSVDHLSFSLSGNGETALFLGDVLHSPVQVAQQEWGTAFCEFPEEALQSRKKILSLALETNALLFTTHFPGTSVGRVTQGGKGPIWQSE